MYVAMPPPKEARINIRIPKDIKNDGKVAAEVRRWNLSQLITDLLRQDIAAVKADNPAAFADAEKRMRETRRKVAISHDKANEKDTRRQSSGIQAPRRARAVGGGSGRKR